MMLKVFKYELLVTNNVCKNDYRNSYNIFKKLILFKKKSPRNVKFKLSSRVNPQVKAKALSHALKGL